jgi:hypothetical protein
MARPCELCGANLDIVGNRHRCIGGKPAGQRQPTKLQKDKIARGEMTSADLAPKATPVPSVQPGRLAKLSPSDIRPAPVRQPQPSPADILAAIQRLTAAFEALRSALQDKPRTDA